MVGLIHTALGFLFSVCVFLSRVCVCVQQLKKKFMSFKESKGRFFWIWEEENKEENDVIIL